MRKVMLLLAAMVLPAITTGCISLKVGADMSDTPTFKLADPIVNAYADLEGIKPYNGTIAELHFLDSFNRNGEIASIGVWPLAELGIGLLGARVQLLPLQAGFGSLFYTPGPSEGGVDVDVDVDADRRRGGASVSGSASVERR